MHINPTDGRLIRMLIEARMDRFPEPEQSMLWELHQRIEGGSMEVTSRPHADKAALYYSDSRMKCWFRGSSRQWLATAFPDWEGEAEYHVGLEPPPPEPRMIEWMGERFRAPLTEAPPTYTSVWVALSISGETGVHETWWGNTPNDLRLLADRRIHLRQEDAEAHSRALRKANEQAMKGGA